eukprot:4087472-Pyramimonas_sp.AAC.1
MDAVYFSRGPTTWAATAAQATTAAQAGATEQQSAAAGAELNPQPTVVQKPHDRGGYGAADQVSGTVAYRLEVAHNTLQSTSEAFTEATEYGEMALHVLHQQRERVVTTLG